MPLHMGAVSGGTTGARRESENFDFEQDDSEAFKVLEMRSMTNPNGSMYGVFVHDDSDSSDGGVEQLSPCRFKTLMILEKPCWSALVFLAIGLNTGMMAIQCNHPKWDYWYIFEDSFLAFFCVEMAMRLYVYRLQFFTNKKEIVWNVFDLTIVVTGILDVCLSKALEGTKRGENLVIIFRIIRIVRVLRSCRLLKHFKQLYLLVQGFLHSLAAVYWIGVLFFHLVLIAGIVTTTIVGEAADQWEDKDDRKQILDLFGTLNRSMVTMFQLVTLDNWGDINVLVAKQMPLMTIFFIIYILATAFAMIALLTGVITEQVTALSRESEHAEKEMAFQKYLENLEIVFRKGEQVEGDGITFEDLVQVLQDPQVAEKMDLTKNKMSLSDLHEIFVAMDYSGDGRVSWDEFRQGMKELRGTAAAKEVALLRADINVLRQLVCSLIGGPDVGSRIASLESQVQRLEKTVQSLHMQNGHAASTPQKQYLALT